MTYIAQKITKETLSRIEQIYQGNFLYLVSLNNENFFNFHGGWAVIYF